jgi:ankyrin repeat protein
VCATGSTALMWACANGHEKVVDVLLKHGVRLDARNNAHKNAMELAVDGGHKEVVKKLKKAAEYEWYHANKREAAADSLAASVSRGCLCDVCVRLIM